MDDNEYKDQDDRTLGKIGNEREKNGDELWQIVHQQRTQRIAFQIGLLLVAHAFLVIAFVADQISAFTEVRLEWDHTRITQSRYCGLMALYSKIDDIAINPSLTEGAKKKWKFSNAEEECIPINSTDAEAQAVCEAFVEFGDKISLYVTLLMVALGICFLNLIIHSYRLYSHLNQDTFDPEDDPLRLWLCAPAKLIYWFECVLYVGASTCLILSVFWFPILAGDTYCWDKGYTGICEGEYVLSQLTCGWQLGSSNFHLLVSAFFQVVGALIKLKQLLCTHMISYKSRLVFPERTNSISME